MPLELKPVDKMFCDAVMVEAVAYDWPSDQIGEAWDTILPSADGMTLAEIRTALEDAGWDLPSELQYDELRRLLEDNDHYIPELGPDTTEEEAVKRMMEAVETEFRNNEDFLKEWREAYEEAMQETSHDRFGPMMNYYYPIPEYDGDVRKDQRVLDQYGGAVVLATVNDTPVLALSGGGMDLSQDICEAYMLLGYLPPFTFTRLPEFAGQTLTPKMEWVFAGCLRTAEVIKQWVNNRETDLIAYRRKLRGDAAPEQNLGIDDAV